MSTGDDLAEFAIDYIVSGRGSARGLARLLAQRWPERPALEYCYALSVAASSIEEVLSGEEVARLSQDAFRMAALIGVDLFVAQSEGLPHHSGAELMAYWQACDPFFLVG